MDAAESGVLARTVKKGSFFRSKMTLFLLPKGQGWEFCPEVADEVSKRGQKVVQKVSKSDLFLSTFWTRFKVKVEGFCPQRDLKNGSKKRSKNGSQRGQPEAYWKAKTAGTGTSGMHPRHPLRACTHGTNTRTHGTTVHMHPRDHRTHAPRVLYGPLWVLYGSSMGPLGSLSPWVL